MYHVYLIQNEDNELYIGRTNDLKRRFIEHQTHKNRSTKNHSWELIYYEAYKSESDAQKRESGLKYHGQAVGQLKRRISESRRRES